MYLVEKLIFLFPETNFGIYNVLEMHTLNIYNVNVVSTSWAV